MCIVTIAELVLDEGGYHRFEVNEKLCGEAVADAERFAEQARNERDEEETSRTAEFGTTHVSAKKVSEDTQKISGGDGGLEG